MKASLLLAKLATPLARLALRIRALVANLGAGFLDTGSLSGFDFCQFLLHPAREFAPARLGQSNLIEVARHEPYYERRQAGDDRQ